MGFKLNISGYGIAYPDVDTVASRNNAYDRNNTLVTGGAVLSSRAKNKLRNLCTYLYSINSEKLNFFTFTIPTAKNKLGSFEVFQSDHFYITRFSMLLENLRKHYGLRNYFWVVERQMKNNRGALHFHCVFDCDFISVQRLARYWSKLLKEYHVESKNCVDVKKIFNVKSLSTYLSKYITKNDQKIYGRIWACSRKYSEYIRKSSVTIPYDQINDVVCLADCVKEKNLPLKNGGTLNLTIATFSFQVLLENYYKIFGIRFKPRLAKAPPKKSADNLHLKNKNLCKLEVMQH